MTGPSGDGLIVGIDITYEQLARRLASANAATERSAQNMERRFKAANQNISRGFQASNKSAAAFGSNGLRQVSLQLNQVAQQGAITGDYMRALAIQMPDILLGFGTLGVLAGVAVGALTPLAMTFLQSAEEAKSFGDTITDLSKAMGEFSKASDAARAPIGDLIEQYGMFASRASELLEIQRQLAYLDSATSLSRAAASATELFGNLSDLVVPLENGVGLTNELARQFNSMNPAAVFEIAEQLGIAAPEAALLAEQMLKLQEAQGPEAIAAALRNVIEQLELATGGAFEMNEETRAYYENLLLAEDAALRLAAVDLAAGVREAADEAGRFAENMRRASSLEYGKIQNEFGSGPDAARSEMWQNAPSAPQPTGAGRANQVVSSRGRSSGGGRTATANAAGGFDPAFLAAVAERVAMVTAEIEALEAANESLEDAVGDAFVGMVTGADSARDAIGNLLNDLGRLFAQVGFQNLVTGLGGFGQLGGLLKTFDGGGFTGMGPRAGGIDGKGGFPAILHPNETVLDHTRGQGGNPVSVVVNIDAKGAQDSGRGAMGAVPQIRAAVVAAMNDAQRRGYR